MSLIYLFLNAVSLSSWIFWADSRSVWGFRGRGWFTVVAVAVAVAAAVVVVVVVVVVVGGGGGVGVVVEVVAVGGVHSSSEW